MIRRSRLDFVPGSHDDPGYIRALEATLKDPPNLSSLPDEMRAKWEEEKYRRALKWRWGFLPGDPRLQSIKKDGTPKEAVFGPSVDVKVFEEDESHEGND